MVSFIHTGTSVVVKSSYFFVLHFANKCVLRTFFGKMVKLSKMELKLLSPLDLPVKIIFSSISIITSLSVIVSAFI